MLTIGVIGFGTIGKEIAKLINDQKSEELELKSVLVRNAAHAKVLPDSNFEITTDEEHFFNQHLDVIVEAAGHNAVFQYGEKALSSGSHFMIISVGALADQVLYDSLLNTAKKNKTQLIIPSAAIGGLDRVTAGSLGKIDDITLITRKPTKSWYGTIAEEKVDLETISEPYCLFEGNARVAAKLYPENVNVSAALSLAGVGFEKTNVQIYVDPTISRNKHTIVAQGVFGKMEISIENSPFKENPKSSPIVAMSVVKIIKNMVSPLKIGI